MENFLKIKTDTIQSQVYERIKEMIINGKWQPGYKIPSEAVLTEMLGVGRVSVRAALQYLSAQGFIDTRRGEGSYVKSLGIKEYLNFMSPILQIKKYDIISVIEFRNVMEVNMIPLIMENLKDSDIEKLEYIYQSMIDNKNNNDLFAEEDARFHYHLAEMTNNSLIISVTQVIWDILLKTMKINIKIMSTSNAIIYHKKMLEALKIKDEILFTNIMKKHLDVAKNYILENG